MQMEQSKTIFERGTQIIPGGVNSPVRAFGAVGGTPPVIKKASGPYLWDVDGNQYIDYVASWGPAILGHAHPAIVSAVKEACDNGLSFGAPTEGEVLLAEKIREFFPSMEMSRLVSTGTEACMSAIRLARGFTGRNKIIKFNGNYHGHADMLLVKAGSGVATFNLPGSPGVPEAAVQDTLLAEFNRLETVESLFEKHGQDIACIIVEPFMGNGGFIRGENSFLQGLRQLCDKFQSVLIFDEVMTGFRVGKGGVQGLVDIKPDLTTLGKIIGGGLPLAVYGGRKDIMKKLAPEGPVYQAGTLSGNPLAVASGLATLDQLAQPGFYEELSEKTKTLVNGLRSSSESTSTALQIDCEGGMFGFFFNDQPITTFQEAHAANNDKFKSFFWNMLKKGVYLAASSYEAGFVSFSHSKEDIAQTVEKARQSMELL